MKRRRRQSHPSRDRWLVSYADFITLLFAFFVVLYASSRADLRKQAQFAASINTAFSTLDIFPQNGPANGTGPVDLPPAAKASLTVTEDLTRIKIDLQHKLANQIAEHTVAIQLGPNGLVISLREAGFYHSGSATPRSSAIPTIAKIVTELRPTPYALRIEGHTDNVPIHNSKYNSNWELSTARATYLTRLFIRQFNLQPARLSAAGYAQYHPIASNATAAGRAENRRVDIIALPHGYIAAPPLASPNTTATNPETTKAHPSAIASSKAAKPSPYR